MTAKHANTSPLADTAVTDGASRGRVHAEPGSGQPGESSFERDRTRVLNSMAFRRLMHKTQVFVTGISDHFRTRLTHTLEVVAQAQRLARRLGLNDRLAGAIALAHDLGHPPFGHAGETALAARMARHGGFEHNLQSLRVVTYLEHPYPDFRGLNLTFEVRESLIKHRTRFDHPERMEGLDAESAALLEAGPMPPLEGQVVNLADTIAYTLHDIEDGLGTDAIGEPDLNKSSLWREAAEGVRRRHRNESLHAVRRPILDTLASRLTEDAAAESLRCLKDARVAGVDAVRRHSGELIAFTDGAQAGIDELQAVLSESLYRNHRVIRMDFKARRLIDDLFEAYLAEPKLMPQRFSGRVDAQGLQRVVCDYIAGMTDRFCQEEHRRLYAPFHFG